MAMTRIGTKQVPRTWKVNIKNRINNTSLLEYLRLTKHLKELGLDTVSKLHPFTYNVPHFDDTNKFNYGTKIEKCLFYKFDFVECTLSCYSAEFDRDWQTRHTVVTDINIHITKQISIFNLPANGHTLSYEIREFITAAEEVVCIPSRTTISFWTKLRHWFQCKNFAWIFNNIFFSIFTRK
jgi:hypothetical protein